MSGKSEKISRRDSNPFRIRPAPNQPALKKLKTEMVTTNRPQLGLEDRMNSASIGKQAAPSAQPDPKRPTYGT
jgi:hypothetical protein